jgi:hypothetical protein
LDLLSKRSTTLTRRDDRVLNRRFKREARRIETPAAANVVTGRYVEQRIVTGS